LIAIIDENEPFIGWFLVQKLQISLHSWEFLKDERFWVHF
jgi:hypothetical protein